MSCITAQTGIKDKYRSTKGIFLKCFQNAIIWLNYVLEDMKKQFFEITIKIAPPGGWHERKPHFSDLLGFASKFQNLLSIARGSNFISYYWQHFVNVDTILLSKQKIPVFCLFWCFCQNAAKFSSVTQIFSLIILIHMMFRVCIQSFIEISMWEPGQKKLSNLKMNDLRKAHLTEYTQLLIWL